jgi:hypothetical protein
MRAAEAAHAEAGRAAEALEERGVMPCSASAGWPGVRFLLKNVYGEDMRKPKELPGKP